MREGDFAAEIAPVAIKSGKGETIDRRGRAAAQGAPRQDPVAQARVPRRRHGDRRQFELDLRRRGGARPDAPQRSRAARRSRRWRASSRHATLRARAEVISPPRRSARSASCSTGSAGRRAVDLFEINEAFAVVAMAAMRELELAARQGQRQRRRLRARPPDRRLRRPHRGHVDRRACRRAACERGVAALCIGGGEATAMAIERAG